MRLTCPHCGERDHREFDYVGSAELMHRPAPDAGDKAFFDYVYLRKNPAGEHDELWHHVMGCRAFLHVRRNITTHDVSEVKLVRDAREGGK